MDRAEPHPPEHVRSPSWDEFQKLQTAAGNRICLVTLAPEAEGAIDFIRKAVREKITIAIGHTAAKPEQIQLAVEAGAKLSTHLGNGSHGTLKRHPNYIWEQIGESKLFASIIADGAHLPATVVRSIIHSKGPLHTILTCDASGLAGCEPGLYSEGSIDVEVLEEGPIVIAGQRQFLAGSGVETDTCIRLAREMTSLSWKECWEMASLNPARLLGFEQIRLLRGCRADLVQFREHGVQNRLEIVSTIQNGTLHWGEVF